MPRITGMELLQEVRTGCAETKVILMTAYASVDTAVEALRRQADDFLVKPFALSELRQQVREALPVEQEPAGIFSYRDLVVDVNARQAWLEERELQLTRQEYGVLACLAEQQKCPVPWQELICRVWGYSEPSRRDLGNLRSCVRRLREKLGDSARDPQYIVTRWGEGYQLGK
jgi:DNA-binding response OmpR family regulator